MLFATVVVAISLAAPPQLFQSADGNRWRVTRTAGANPSPGYEQWYLDVERLTTDGAVAEVINFEEVAWVEGSPPTIRSTRVTFSVDARGVFQAEQRSTVQLPKAKAEVKVVTFKWDGKAFRPVPAGNERPASHYARDP